MYKVLIAEDEAIVRLGLKNMLDWESMDMQVTALAADGEDAWRLFCAEQHDIVLTDLRMPHLDGMELINRIRRTEANTKIIILTCVDDLAMVQQALELGVTGYILKLTAGVEEITRLLNKAKDALDKENTAEKTREWFNIDLVKRQVWGEFVIAHNLTAQDFEAFCQKANLRLNSSVLQVLVVRLLNCDRLSGNVGMSKAHRYQYVQDMISNYLAKHPYGECVQGRSGEYSILVSADKVSEVPSEEIAKAVDLILYQNIGINVVCGVSEVGQGFDCLPTLYEQAVADRAEKEKGNTALPSRIMQAIDYIQTHFREDISLQSVAETLNITPNYLSHIFTKHLNVSFVNYLNNLRVEYAKELLKDPAMRIYEVGTSAGFYSTAYFVRVFKKATGQTPTEFRNGGPHETPF